jgi:S1-C subfamily serine protease
MSSPVRPIVIVVAGAIAIAGTLYWKAHRSQQVVAPLATSGPAPSALEAAIAAANAAPSPSPAQPDSTRADVAARVEAAYAASKAKAEAERLAALANPPELTLEDLISRSLPAVVRVETNEGLGTGFFISPDTILTNVHVVGSASTVTIRRAGGATQMARVDSRAPELDIAIVHISNPNPDQPTLAMGSASRTRAGQEVIALGSPLGLQNTVTRGIVSAVREVGGLTLVQTDAAINPGNSGGPLLDRTGQVIGITSLGMRSSVAQGLSFAIAIEHAQGLLAGKPSSGTAGTTPLTTLNDAMTGEKKPTDADQSRDRAVKAYEQAIATVAQRADQLDGRWRSFVRSCYSGQIGGSFDRPWFAIYDSRAMQGAVSPGCTDAYDDIQRVANDIRGAIGRLDEAARQADIFPGTRRDVLRRFRLDNPAWTR